MLGILLAAAALLFTLFSCVCVYRMRRALRKQQDQLSRSIMRLGEAFDVLRALENRCAKLEQGIVPDMEKAREAVTAVNDFNASLTAILNYDPYESLRRARQEEKGVMNDG